MARKVNVTRTFVTMKVHALALDMTSRQTLEKDYVLPRVIEKEEKILKAIVALESDNKVIPVKVLSTEQVETLYGCTEEEFLSIAKPLPPRGTKEEANADSENA